MIVGLVAIGTSNAEILDAYPYLEEEDIRQALSYAAWRVQEIEGLIVLNMELRRHQGKSKITYCEIVYLSVLSLTVRGFGTGTVSDNVSLITRVFHRVFVDALKHNYPLLDHTKRTPVHLLQPIAVQFGDDRPVQDPA